MAKLTQITGLKEVLHNLSTFKVNLAAKVQRGLKKGGTHLLKATDPYTPVDKGNLRNSKFIRHTGTGFNTDVRVGFTADYATVVHEDLTKAHGENFNVKYADEIAAGTVPNRGEKQQAKFLERPAREERPTILKIIHREARL